VGTTPKKSEWEIEDNERVINAVIAIVAAFVLGGIPFALIAGKVLKGIDIRVEGSGNLGATNAFRVLGPGAGIAVLLADGAKGAVAVLLAKALMAGVSGPAGYYVPVLCAPAAMAGHTWTVFAGFRGGKGVAAGAGAFLALAPLATGAVIAVWALLFAISGYVSVGSMAAAVVFPPAVYLTAHGQDRAVLLSVSIIAAALVLLRHVPNMRRLAAGTENKLLRRTRGG
jgi:glycerol-3-phosphate acyltransferase PlsY